MAEGMGIFPLGDIEEYEAHMLGHAGAADELFTETAKALSLKGASQLLDLCCGTGRELDEIMKLSPWISVTGIDPSPGMLAKLLAKPYASRLSLIDCQTLAVPLGSCVYDAAVTCLAMHHFPAADRLILYRKIFGALRSGGRYVECDLAARDQAEEDALEGNAAGYERPTTPEFTLRLMREAGFRAEIHWRRDNHAIIVARKDGKK